MHPHVAARATSASVWTKFGISWVQAAHLLGLLVGGQSVVHWIKGTFISKSRRKGPFFARPLAQHTRLSQWAPTGWLDFGRGIRLTRSVPSSTTSNASATFVLTVRTWSTMARNNGSCTFSSSRLLQQNSCAHCRKSQWNYQKWRSCSCHSSRGLCIAENSWCWMAQRAWGRLSMHGLSLAQITHMKPIVPGCWSPTWGNMMYYGTGVWCLMKLVSILSWSTKNCFRRRLPKFHLGTRRQACMFIASGFGMSLLLSHPMSGPPNWSSSLKKIGNG